MFFFPPFKLICLRVFFLLFFIFFFKNGFQIDLFISLKGHQSYLPVDVSILNWTCVKGWRTYTGKRVQHKSMINRKMRIVDSWQFEDYVENGDIVGIEIVTKSSWFFVYFVFESVSHSFLKRLISYVNQVVPSEWSTNSNLNCAYHRCLNVPKAIIRFNFFFFFFSFHFFLFFFFHK